MDGMYFQKKMMIEEGDSFGAEALINRTGHSATIMTEGGDAHFATLSKDNFNQSIKKIETHR